MKDIEKKSTDKEDGFMLSIWLITLFSMIGTGLVAYSVSNHKLQNQHKMNVEQIEHVNFRTTKISAYRDILKNEGREKALEYLNKN